MFTFEVVPNQRRIEAMVIQDTSQLSQGPYGVYSYMGRQFISKHPNGAQRQPIMNNIIVFQEVPICLTVPEFERMYDVFAASGSNGLLTDIGVGAKNC